MLAYEGKPQTYQAVIHVLQVVVVATRLLSGEAGVVVLATVDQLLDPRDPS